MTNVSARSQVSTNHHHHQTSPNMNNTTATMDVSRFLIQRASEPQVRIRLPASSTRNFRRRPRQHVWRRPPKAGDKRPAVDKRPTEELTSDETKAKKHKKEEQSTTAECKTSEMGSVFVSLPNHDRPVRRSVRLAIKRGSFL
jgi:hypothetical protein